jgi:hypothetical protein
MIRMLEKGYILKDEPAVMARARAELGIAEI